MTITWKIEQLERLTADGVVTTVHWRVLANDGVNNATVYGSLGVTAGETVIPFEELTEEVVIGWVKDSLGEETVAAHEAALTAQLAALAAPVTASGLPWTPVEPSVE